MRRFLPIIALLLLLASCVQKVETELALTLRSAVVGAEAGIMWMKVEASCPWTISLEFIDGSGWATADQISGQAGEYDIRLRFTANEDEQARGLIVVLKGTPEGEICQSVLQSGYGGSVVPEDHIYGYDTAPCGWLELPATVADDGLSLLIHNYDGGLYESRARDGVRNYSCYWDFNEHLSLWVAYPLNKSLRGKGGYDYVWGFDPLLPASLQPDITMHSYGGAAFGGGNWNRGHQLPRADRQLNQSSVSSTCYPTNMTPQDGSFNSGIWAKLEGAVRGYADRADTMYVVTGCLYSGSKTWTERYSGFAVRVPTHYFKALLYHGVSTYATDGYMMAAFLLPHSASIANKNYLDYIMSVDALEVETGIDFFPNLRSEIGAEAADRLEAAQPSNFWK